MSVAPPARRIEAGTLALGSLLLALTAWSWMDVWRRSHQPMAMGGMMSPPLFVLQWGVMMAAMMLPSAAPTILLYRTVRNRLVTWGEHAVPASLFGAIYLLLWTLLGIPVYGAYLAAGMLSAAWRPFVSLGVAAILVMAGLYQFTAAKRRCLTACESPMSFLMARWRTGYRASLGLATRHALYCVGCCWALMIVLVAAGAMGIWWVAAIALVVFLEKCLPHGQLTARVVGLALILLGAAVFWRPGFAAVFRSL
jgi:predicted metal-binding membrane protein